MEVEMTPSRGIQSTKLFIEEILGMPSWRTSRGKQSWEGSLSMKSLRKGPHQENVLHGTQREKGVEGRWWHLAGSRPEKGPLAGDLSRKPTDLSIRRTLLAFHLASHHISRLMKTKLCGASGASSYQPSVSDTIHGVTLHDESDCDWIAAECRWECSLPPFKYQQRR